MATLNYADVLALSEGTIFVTMDGKNIPLIEVEEATASIEFNKEDVFALGKRFKGSKVTSATGKGKMTSYFMPDKVDLFMLKADDGIAENEMDFTFDDFTLTESFTDMK